MVSIQVLKHLYGKAVTGIKAYGIDKYDFTRSILGADFSVGQYGYTVFEFGNDHMYISIDGISSTIPPRREVIELPVHITIIETFLGAVLQSIDFDGEEYSIQFDGLDPLRGYYDSNDGMCDRSYFDLEFPWF